MNPRDAYIRPSSIEAIALCPGRPTMEAAVVERFGKQEASPEADMGHDLHARAQKCVVDWKLANERGEGPTTLAESIAITMDVAKADRLDSWSIHCLATALQQVHELIQKYGVAPENVLAEHGLDLAALGFTQKGTADVVLVVPFKLVIVIDYKFGFVDQCAADEHDQIQVYATAAADTFQVPEVLVYVLQPRAEKAHRITAARFDADALRANRAWTAAVINRARQPNPELVAGHTQCDYCKAFGHCAAFKEFLMNTQEAVELIGEPATPGAWSIQIAAAKLAQKWGELWADKGKAHLMAGGVVPGFKLGSPRAIPSIANPAGALACLEAQGFSPIKLAEDGALTFKVGSLPPAALEAVAAHVTTKLSAPSLVADKAKKAAA